MAIEKITNSTVLAKWAEIINQINDETVSNAESIVNSIGSVYSFTQKVDNDGVDPDNSESFDDALARFLESNPTVVFKKNDVAVVKLVDAADESVVYEQAAYTHDGSNWVACTGAVDADKVILRSDITLAGEYTRVGNLTKSSNTATGTFATKGKSVADALTEMLSKRLQPSITTNPSISAFALKSGTSTSVEAGTTLDKVEYTAGTFDDGAYTYEGTTGVSVTGWEVKRVTRVGNATTDTVASIRTVEGASLTAGSDDNGGKGFQIGDQAGTYGEGDAATPVLSSIKYTAYAAHTAGNLAKGNLGSPCTNSTQIAATTDSTRKTKTTSAITCYRNYFYGAVSTTSDIDSDYIRGLTKSGKAYAATGNSPLKITTTADTRRIVIACIAGKTGVTKVLEPTFGSDVLSVFDKKTIQVAGANGYAPVDYNVWVWEQENDWGEVATYSVTLG
jgi:hypothetical protein